MNIGFLNKITEKVIQNKRRRALYLLIVLVPAFFVIQTLSKEYLTVIPVNGGTFSEAIVWYPRFVNPVLAFSQTDKDLSQLIFSGLLRQDTDGDFVPELAESYTVNNDATAYEVTLSPDRFFHDGSRVSVDDVIFTYELIKDPLLKSPLYPRLMDVSIEKIDENTVRFIPRDSNPQFLKNLTLGIMSKSQWTNVSREELPFADQNISAVGTGPYKIDSIVRDSQQKISSYILRAFRNNSQQPYIEVIELKFYADQLQALNSFETGLIDNLSNISAQQLLVLDHSLDEKNIQTQALSRIFTLFFNTSHHDALSDKAVRQAIRDSINTQEIVTQVFFNRADTVDGPVPMDNEHYLSVENDGRPSAEKIKADLEKAGWKLQEDSIRTKASSSLEFTIHVPESPELVNSADIIARQLLQSNILLNIIVVPESQIVDHIVRKREFEMLLFGQIVNNPIQLYAFWHSSGITDPGVNIASYNNKTVDAILERIIDPGTDSEKMHQDYQNLQKKIRDDVPAVFLFTPHFIYASDKKIKRNQLPDIEFATDRWNTISNWYIDTESLLPFFTH